jgi:hypothetical protein
MKIIKIDCYLDDEVCVVLNEILLQNKTIQVLGLCGNFSKNYKR